MTESRVPRWLIAAREKAGGERTGRQRTESAERTIRAGDFRLAHSIDYPGDGPTRVVVVLRVHPQSDIIEVALVSTEVELATDWDLALEGSLTGVGYDVIAELDLTVPVWRSQIGRCIGSLPREHLRRVQTYRAMEDTSDQWLRGRCGLPLQPGGSTRRAWKREELRVAQQLAEGAIRALLEEDCDHILDVALLPTRHEDVETCRAKLRAILRIRSEVPSLRLPIRSLRAPSIEVPESVREFCSAADLRQLAAPMVNAALARASQFGAPRNVQLTGSIKIPTSVTERLTEFALELVSSDRGAGCFHTHPAAWGEAFPLRIPAEVDGKHAAHIDIEVHAG